MPPLHQAGDVDNTKDSNEITNICFKVFDAFGYVFADIATSKAWSGRTSTTTEA